MKGKDISSLRFAVRLRVIGKFLGLLLLIFSAFTTAPLFFSLAVGEHHLLVPYASAALSALVAGFLLQRIHAPTDIQVNEALVISSLIFIIASLLGAIPFHMGNMSWMDAFFEAVSGYTTTGLSNLATVENQPRTFLFSRAWMQWIGGLGIVVLSVAIIMPQSKATLHLFKQNWEKEGIVANTKSYAWIIIQVYLLLSVAGFLLLLLLGEDWFDSMLHVLAAVSTGGFSPNDNSLSGLHSLNAQALAMFLSCLGAVPFFLYYMLLRNGWRELIENEEIKGLVLAAIAATGIMILMLVAADGFSLHRGIREGILLGLSAQTTTGFSTVSVPELSAASKAMLIPFMMIGGNVGSTAGGIKILRLLILLQIIRLMVIRSGMPQDAVIQPRLNGRRLSQQEIERCLLLVILFVFTVLVSWLPFIIAGYPALDSLFEVVSATCTVGLSSGISSSSLPAMLKGILCLDMLAGRLEIVALLVLVSPGTWIGRKKGG